MLEFQLINQNKAKKLLLPSDIEHLKTTTFIKNKISKTTLNTFKNRGISFGFFLLFYWLNKSHII